ncbi:MAG: SDR family NAD(P)-dependent oxidoreductase [Christensenellales bacterium]
MEIRFDGQTALVTGGSRGLGKSIAMTLAASGADIVLCDMLEKESQQTCKEIKALGRKADYFIADVADYEQVEKMVHAIPALHIMVHAAGIVLNSLLLDATQAEIKRIFDVNILGSSNMVQSVLKKMIPQKSGKIVLIASVAGKIANITMPHYRMTKAAVISLAMTAAFTAAPHNITVNAICPGIIKTPMWDKILDDRSAQLNKPREEIWENIVKDLIPLGHAQSEQDIANAAAFLCSNLADNITGQAINVCGGQCMRA